VPDLSWWLEAPLLGLTLVVIAPVLEEWTFRGWLFDTFRTYFNRHDWASIAQLSVISLHNLTTSVLFVGLHIVMRDVQTGLLVLLPSLVLGLLRDRGASLMSVMSIHGLWNFGWFAIYSPG
jgi:membrane protease YdiL (CAAX protease family)